MSLSPNYAPDFSSSVWARVEDRRNARNDAQARAEADRAYEFGKVIEAGDPAATPAWAGTVPDTDAGRRSGLAFNDPNYPRRRLSAADVLGESLDYPGGPGMADVLMVLSHALRSTDPMVALIARQLVERCGRKYAEHNAFAAEVDE